MKVTIKNFFDKYISLSSDSADDHSSETDEHALRLATAALLIEMTRADYEVKEEERRVVNKSIKSKFKLTQSETEELISLAEEEVDQAVSSHQFTALINKAFTPEQKVKIVEYLWRVAYADAELEKYEEHLVRKLADLLYVPHPDFIAAKHRAQEYMEKNKGK